MFSVVKFIMFVSAASGQSLCCVLSATCTECALLQLSFKVSRVGS